MNDLGQKIPTADVHIDETFTNSHFKPSQLSNAVIFSFFVWIVAVEYKLDCIFFALINYNNISSG